MRCLMWFREDLRVSDNMALHYACASANDGVIAIFLITPDIWQRHDVAACKIEFMLRGLHELQTELAQLNIPLLIHYVKADQELPHILLKLAQQHHVTRLFFNKQYEIDESRRDQKVILTLEQQGIKVYSYHDQVIAEPGSIVNQQGNYYKVFTPFKNAWLMAVQAKGYTIYPKPKSQKLLSLPPDVLPEKIAGFQSNIAPDLWQAGEAIAKQKLYDFARQKLTAYQATRDFPAKAGTSQLSPYLNSGMLSIRTCLKTAQEANNGLFVSDHGGTTTWINELIWREFYRHILVTFPRVSMHRPFKLETEQLNWSNNPTHFQAWQAGQTGYPLVDAAMRQLSQTGWMHNRLRMVVAMFLSKTLFIDWRWGEKYFMQHLIDGDLASNNGGWQWSASTGTDSVPYFRIFNPILQSERYDPMGKFIRSYCPELAQLNNKQIHFPYASGLIQQKLDYPRPIVDHASHKQEVLTAFKQLKLNQA